MVDADTWQASAPAFASDAARLQIEWLPDGRTVALTGAAARSRLFDVDRSVARTGLPAAVGDVATPSFMVPGPTDDLVVLSDQDWVMSYPMTPSAWLRDGLRDRGPRPDSRPSGTSTCRAGRTRPPAATWSEAARRRPRPGGGGRRLAGCGVSSRS